MNLYTPKYNQRLVDPSTTTVNHSTFYNPFLTQTNPLLFPKTPLQLKISYWYDNPCTLTSTPLSNPVLYLKPLNSQIPIRNYGTLTPSTESLLPLFFLRVLTTEGCKSPVLFRFLGRFLWLFPRRSRQVPFDPQIADPTFVDSSRVVLPLGFRPRVRRLVIVSGWLREKEQKDLYEGRGVWVLRRESGLYVTGKLLHGAEN